MMFRMCSNWRHSLNFLRRFSAQTSLEVGRYRPRRAVMYVPGMDKRKMEKIPSVGVDTVVFDMEDGVAVDQKETARHMIPETLSQLSIPATTEVTVRVNGLDSNLIREDLQVVLEKSPNGLPEALMVPKVQSSEDIAEVDRLVGEFRPSAKHQPLPLFVIIESPMGLLNLRDICYHGTRKCEAIRLQVIVFGSDDYLAMIGGVRSEDASELMFARQSIVTHAKAYQLQAIDLVHINFRDLTSLKRQSQEGAWMGFTGKQAIHPTQVGVVQEAFTPTHDQITWATGLIEEFDKHQKLGKGAFTYQGRMIDKPLLLQAENIVNLHNAISGRTNS